MPAPVLHNTRKMPEPAPINRPATADVFALWDKGHDTREIGLRLQSPEWLIYRMIAHTDRRLDYQRRERPSPVAGE